MHCFLGAVSVETSQHEAPCHDFGVWMTQETVNHLSPGVEAERP